MAEERIPTWRATSLIVISSISLLLGLDLKHTLTIILDSSSCYKRTQTLGCGSFFCTRLTWPRRGRRRTPQKRLAPRIASAKTTRRLPREGLSRKFGASVARWMGKPSYPCSPVDEGPKGAVQSLLALCLPPTAAQRPSLRSRCRPRLVPASIADRIAQHQHGIDVLPLPAHARAFEAGFHHHLVGTFHAARANRPACLLIGGVLHVRLTLLQIGQFLLDGATGIASGQPAQVFEHSLRSLVFEPVQHSVQPGGRQSASSCLHGLPDLTDVFGGMGKIQDGHRICTVVVD